MEQQHLMALGKEKEQVETLDCVKERESRPGGGREELGGLFVLFI